VVHLNRSDEQPEDPNLTTLRGCFFIPKCPVVPDSSRVQMGEMTPRQIDEYLADAGVQLGKYEKEDFSDFVRFYFKELVKMGAFLKDVPFSDLTTRARYCVFKSGYDLWIKVGKSNTSDIITSTEIEFSA